MSAFQEEKEGQDGGEDAYVPREVLEALDDLEEGRTMSDADFEDALRF